MFIAILSIAAIIAAIYFMKKPPANNAFKNKAIIIGLWSFGVFGLLSRSFLIVGGNELATLDKIYFGSDLPTGQIIATNGEKGPQAEIIGPGFHFIPLVNIIFDVEYHPVIEVPEGEYALIKAKDGMSLEMGEFLAKPWPTKIDGIDNYREDMMMDAKFFLDNGGQKGPQFNVLKPGKYRINPFLFETELLPVTDVPTGSVAVVRSNVRSDESVNCPDPSIAESKGGESVALPLVPKGCIGVWEKPLPPGRYYLNEKAFVTTEIPTRLQTWNYKGGYTKRTINLKVEDDGKITQEVTEKIIETPKDAADSAINVRSEGWTIPVDFRVIVAVNPANAAKVVASVGGIKQVEDNIITPAIRDVLRTIGGSPDRKVLDFVEKRDEIVSLVEKSIIPEGLKAGITIQEVRMGEPSIPPELLVATLREQLASQLEETYKQEKKAQEERIQVEKERATANQQSTLVEAQIKEQAAEFIKNQQQKLGEGEKLKLLEIAKGQKAQANVLGKEAALQLAALEKAIAGAVQNPDIVKVPYVSVEGAQAGSYEGAAAILGASNLIKSLRGIQGNQAQK